MAKRFTEEFLQKNNVMNNNDLLLQDIKFTIIYLYDRVKHLNNNRKSYLALIPDGAPDFKNLQEEFVRAQQISSREDFQFVIRLLSNVPLVFLYTALENFKKRYKELLEGTNITPNAIFSCIEHLQEIIPQYTKFLATDESSVIRIHKNLARLQFQEILDEAIRSEIGFMQEVQGDITCCLNNFRLFSNNLTSRLLNALCRYVVIKARERFLIANKVLNIKVLMARICADKHLAELITKLRAVPGFPLDNQILFEQSIFILSFKEAAILNRLHPKVKRIRYLNQGLSLATHVVMGYCYGGIRLWSQTPLTRPNAEITTVKIQKKRKRNSENGNMQSIPPNPSSRCLKIREPLKELRDHANIPARPVSPTPPETRRNLHKVKFDTEISSLQGDGYIRRNNQENDFVHAITPLLGNMKTIEENKRKKEACSNSEDNAIEYIKKRAREVSLVKFINAMFAEILKTLELYQENACVQIGLHGGNGNGHAIGFRMIRDRSGKILYFCCDYNSGEFYTDDFSALKDWFAGHYYLLRYHEKYARYQINVIRSKTTSQATLIKEAIDNGISTKQLHAITQATALDERAINIIMNYITLECSRLNVLRSPKLQQILTQHQNMIFHSPSLDARNRKKIQELLCVMRELDNTSLELLEGILRKFERIDNKNSMDYVIAFYILLRISYGYLENNQKQTEERWKEFDQVVNILINVNPEYTCLKIPGFLVSIKFYLHYKTLNESESTIVYSWLYDFYQRMIKKNAEMSTFRKLHQDNPKMLNEMDLITEVINNFPIIFKGFADDPDFIRLQKDTLLDYIDRLMHAISVTGIWMEPPLKALWDLAFSSTPHQIVELRT